MNNNQFENLIAYIQLDKTNFAEEISSLFLNNVIVNQKKRFFKFYFSSKKILSVNFLNQLNKKINQSFNDKQINVGVFFDFVGISPSLNDYENIWNFIAIKSSGNYPNIMESASEAIFQESENDIEIIFNQQFGFDFFNARQKTINDLFHSFGYKKNISIQIDKQAADQFSNQFDQHVEKVIAEDVKKYQQSSYHTAIDTKVSISDSIGKTIIDNPKITSVKEVEIGDKVVVEGYVFQTETRNLKNDKVLGMFKLSDFTDSISIKKFAGSRGASKNDILNETLFLKNLSVGDWVRVSGFVDDDQFTREISMMADGIQIISNPKKEIIEDDPKNQRIELHLHTTNTAMSGIDEADKYFQRAKDWSQEAIAITDNASVQSFHDAFKASKATGVKVIYGYEANFVQENQLIAINPSPTVLDDQVYVTFDIETTGLSAIYDKVIELSAVKMKNGEILEEFQEFINPGFPLSQLTINLTHINDEMLKDAKPIKQVFDDFRTFYGDAILAGHNVNFDLGFLNHNYRELNEDIINNPTIDTLTLSRALHPEFGRFTLDYVAKRLNVSLEQHHRAIYDSIATGNVLDVLLKDAIEKYQISKHLELNELMSNSQAWKQVRPTNLTILVKNDIGLKNLFKIVSESSIHYYHMVARVPRSLLDQYREGLLIGSGDLKSEFFDLLLRKGFDNAKEIASYYDYLEVQPLENYDPLIASGDIQDRQQVKKLIQQIFEIAKEVNKPLVVTGDTKFLDKNEAQYREILVTSKIARTFVGAEAKNRSDDLYFRKTDDLINQFSFLGAENAQEIVVKNTHLINSWIDDVKAFKDGLSAPKIDGSEQKIRDIAYQKAHEMYGEQLPQLITDRLEKELKAIIDNGFSVIYLIFQKLVAKSNKDGYLVGSRGSVGSSLVATMLNITEVNPLPPHYRSQNGNYTEFINDPEIFSGFDLPEKINPIDGTLLIGDGQNIPFETFMGFDGTKVPDIDLNFSGDYQPIAHNYTKALFGEDHVFRAGTISKIAERTAIGLVKNYEELNEIKYRSAEESRLAIGLTGVKRTTGQHAGGIIIIPQDKEVTDFTPVQFPSDDQSKGWQTTHFDYHSIDENVLKMDMLGHDDPTILRMLQDLTGIDPKSIPMNDPNVLSLFDSPKALGVSEEQILSKTGTYGVPEMGTNFVRGMLTQTHPKKFGDLLQISGLSHGTGVYLGNADELIRNGQATISTIIGTRDQIMSDLIGYGLDPNDAFRIMETVRKGKGISDEYQAKMFEHNVPQWYIESAQKIQYMFPRSHATAYVMSALRIAWFKVYYPVAYYTAYMTVRSSDITFGAEAMTQGSNAMLAKVKELRAEPKLDKPQQIELAVYEIANEAWQRGVEFKIVDLNLSDAIEWKIVDNKIILPFVAIKGLGENVAKAIVAARGEHFFISKEDLQKRAGVNNTLIGELTRLKVLDNLSDENQINLFDF
jgi:DNA polymerase-3 subunit alpha (Gram-positive type)